MKTLKQLSEELGVPYHTLYQRYKNGKIPDAHKENGTIFIGKAEEPIKTINEPRPAIVDQPVSTIDSIELVEGSVRTNRSASIRPEKRFEHITNSPLPFSYAAGTAYAASDVSIREAVILCQRAYYGFSVFRATIELFTEFCVNNIYFRGGTKKARRFLDLYYKRVGLNKTQDMFYRELWRSGNCFVYRHLGRIDDEEYRELAKMFGGNPTRTAVDIPLRYEILNPADIVALGSISFNQPVYQKVLTDYELERLRNPRTKQDREVLNSLNPEERQKIQSKTNSPVYIELTAKQINAIFLSKQSYEAFSVPLGFGVLEHLNHKRELELMDQAIARTLQQVILLVTTGAEPDKGGINHKNIAALRQIFENESVGRVLISDYTTKAEFVIPQIGDILDPKKYEELNQSIAIGLGNVFLIHGEKFANQNAKVDLFIQRLQSARKMFLEEFLIPEIKYLFTSLGFKGPIPEPYYEELDLKNEIEYAKIYTRLMELGLLTPEEGFDAIQTGRLPSTEDSLENQAQYKQSRDKGMYKPLLAKDPKEEGRPAGSKSPQSKKKISPIGASFSIDKIKDTMILATDLENQLRKTLKDKHKIQEFSSAQNEVIDDIVTNIICNEKLENWIPQIESYLCNPEQTTDRLTEVNDICKEFGVNNYLGGLLLASQETNV